MGVGLVASLFSLIFSGFKIKGILHETYLANNSLFIQIPYAFKLLTVNLFIRICKKTGPKFYLFKFVKVP